MRQWVLSVPKRLRWYLEREPQALSAVLRSFCASSMPPSAGAVALARVPRLGAVSFIHRFGCCLNRHDHYHCSVVGGVFEPV